MIKLILAVGAGSCLGGIARYGLTEMVKHTFGAPGTWGTLAANLLGCLLIGIFYGLLARHTQLADHWRLFLTVGFCGGFTTFSTFVNESHTLILDGRTPLMLLYATASFALGLLALHIGHWMVKG